MTDSRSPDGIAVRDAGGRDRLVEREKVFFAFADGRLNYDCIACGAKCCRGHGYVLATGQELLTQLQARPSLPLFLDRREETNQYNVRNAAPGCFFLTPAGLCEIQETAGYRSKPETCRLFPFNVLAQVGDYLLVLPHPDLCPLEVAPRNTQSDCSAYRNLLSDMASTGIAKELPRFETRGRDPAQAIALERSVVALSEESSDVDYSSFAAAQSRLESNALGAAYHEPPEPQYYVDLSRDLLGSPSRDLLGRDTALLKTLIGITPALRSRFVFQAPGSGLHSRAALVNAGRVSQAMLMIYLLAEAARFAGTNPVTYQTASRLCSTFEPLIWMMAQADLALAWLPGAPIEIASLPDANARLRCVRIAKALMPQAQRDNPQRLGDLLREHSPTDLLERVMFLKTMARHLMSSVGLPGSASPAQGRAGLRAKVRTRVHRWAVATLDEAILQAGYDRAANGAAR